LRFPDLTEEMVAEAEDMLSKLPQLYVLGNQRLSSILIACQLFRMEQAEKDGAK
jgi:hypothetical protein